MIIQQNPTGELRGRPENFLQFNKHIHTPVPTVRPRPYADGPVEFERVVPASGNMQVAGKQFWLGPARSGVTVTFWASTDVIHLTIAGARVKTVRSHLSTADLAALAAAGGRPAGSPPLPPAEPVTAQRRASNTGVIMVAGQKIALGRIHAGQVVTVHVAAETITIDLDDQDSRTVRRTTT
jgi:hypothetical protein